MATPLVLSAEDALAEWARRVRANREQAERVREEPESGDFYAPIAANFAADPQRSGEPELDALRALAEPHETWLDIGAGGGRYALPLALRTREVIALDPSGSMLVVLGEGMEQHRIGNVRIIQSRWPAEDPPEADVALIAHVCYDIEAIGPFLDAMERSARRLCVALLVSPSPASAAASFWPGVQNEPREQLPGLAEFQALQLARGRYCDVEVFEHAPNRYATPDTPLPWLRQQLFIAPGSEKDEKLRALLKERMVERDGGWAFSTEPLHVGLVTWTPPRR